MADSNVLMNLTINEYGEINSGFITYTFSEHITPEENIDNMIELFTEFNTILRESNVPMKSNDLIDYYIPSDEFLEMFRDNLHSAQRKNSFSIKENRRVFYDYSNRNAYSSGTSTTSRETITIHYNLYL